MNTMNMNSKYILLDCDDYIICFVKDIFKVSRFSELVVLEIREKLAMQTINAQQQQQQGTIMKLFKEMNIDEENIAINKIQFQCFKDCQLLTIGSRNWQTGKLKVQISISPLGKHADKVELEFYTDDLNTLLPSDNLGNGSKNMKLPELY